MSKYGTCLRYLITQWSRLTQRRGASRGIGRGIAFHLACRGANILGTCSSDSSLDLIASLQAEVAALYEGHSAGYSAPRIFGVVAPLAEPTKCRDSIVAAVKEHFGTVDILVQNAAIAELRQIDDIDQAHITRSLTGNLETAILLVQGLLPLFRPDSRIVNISSEACRLSRPGGLVYSACKAGMEAMTRVWADALGTRPGMERTTVNALSVGLTMTDMMANLPPTKRTEEFLDRETSKVSVGKRVGTVDDVAEIAGWLCSEKSRWVTGSVTCANGGATKIL